MSPPTERSGPRLAADLAKEIRGVDAWAQSLAAGLPAFTPEEARTVGRMAAELRARAAAR